MAAVFEVFFAALEPSVVFAGAFEPVPDEAGACRQWKRVWVRLRSIVKGRG
jgi:hypothetical protein